jgi:hypothetical protein
MKLWPAPLGSVVTVDNGGPADGKYLVSSMRRSYFSQNGSITLRKPMDEKPEPETEIVTKSTNDPSGGNGSVATSGGAKGIVEDARKIGEHAGGSGVFVVSAYRPGSTTDSGTPSDHSHNDSDQAARDIAVQGIDALVGPPSPKLDKAVVAIGDAFGRDYGDGNKTIIDTFNWKGFRVQIIWRTPLYGGHMGHIHIGARRA